MFQGAITVTRLVGCRHLYTTGMPTLSNPRAHVTDAAFAQARLSIAALNFR
jgi:hypothetical protein